MMFSFQVFIAHARSWKNPNANDAHSVRHGAIARQAEGQVALTQPLPKSRFALLCFYVHVHTLYMYMYYSSLFEPRSCVLRT